MKHTTILTTIIGGALIVAVVVLVAISSECRGYSLRDCFRPVHERDNPMGSR